MSDDIEAAVTAWHSAMSAADPERALALYAEDAQIVRFSGIAVGHAEVRAFLADTLASHGTFTLVSIDDLVTTDDVAEVDATVETRDGLLQTSEVFTFTPDGLIHRHIPAIRGYWGM